MDAIQLIKDIKTMSLGKLRDKYQGIISQVTISDLLKSIESSPGGLEQLIGEWKGDLSDRGGMYLIRSQNQFEVFDKSDRGGKEWPKFHLTLKEAAFDYLDRYLNELEYSAPDSKLGA